MKNPLREMSRPKALATAGIVAGAVAISGVAAAVNVGLLTGSDSAPFDPQKVAATADGSVTTTSTTEGPVEIVYKDVYEQAPSPSVPAVPVAPAPDSAHDDSDDATEDHASATGDAYADDDSDGAYEDHESEDDETEDDETEDDESEDDETEDDSFDD